MRKRNVFRLDRKPVGIRGLLFLERSLEALDDVRHPVGTDGGSTNAVPVQTGLKHCRVPYIEEFLTKLFLCNLNNTCRWVYFPLCSYNMSMYQDLHIVHPWLTPSSTMTLIASYSK